MAELTEEEKLKIILTDKKFRNKFWSNVDKTGGEDACWSWTKGPYNKKKYGQFRVGGSPALGTHIISSTMNLGHFPIADTLHSEQICKGNKKCVNPNHLRDGSEKENRNDENIAGKTPRQRKKRKELFIKIIKESYETEKRVFYDILYDELFNKTYR